MASALPEVLEVWAGNSTWKKPISKLAARNIAGSFTRSDDMFKENEFMRLFEDQRFVKNLHEQLPKIINNLMDALAVGVGTIDSMAAADKKKLLADLLTKTGRGRVGMAITSCARVINEIFKEDPNFLAETLEPGFREWVAAVDFGELKEMLENSAGGLASLVEMVNGAMWQYPAKVVLLLSFLPTLSNIAAKAAGISVSRLNNVSPRPSGRHRHLLSERA